MLEGRKERRGRNEKVRMWLTFIAVALDVAEAVSEYTNTYM
jgi:hypothetical protein